MLTVQNNKEKNLLVEDTNLSYYTQTRIDTFLGKFNLTLAHDIKFSHPS